MPSNILVFTVFFLYVILVTALTIKSNFEHLIKIISLLSHLQGPLACRMFFSVWAICTKGRVFLSLCPSNHPWTRTAGFIRCDFFVVTFFFFFLFFYLFFFLFFLCFFLSLFLSCFVSLFLCFFFIFLFRSLLLSLILSLFQTDKPACIHKLWRKRDRKKEQMLCRYSKR